MKPQITYYGLGKLKSKIDYLSPIQKIGLFYLNNISIFVFNYSSCSLFFIGRLIIRFKEQNGRAGLLFLFEIITIFGYEPKTPYPIHLPVIGL
jgi:hypothetical protein